MQKVGHIRVSVRVPEIAPLAGARAGAGAQARAAQVMALAPARPVDDVLDTVGQVKWSFYFGRHGPGPGGAHATSLPASSYERKFLPCAPTCRRRAPL
jgi:hypothetical protein